MAKRGHGEGSIRFMKASNRYQYRITYKDANGKSHRKSFYGTKAAEARKKGNDWLAFYESSNKSSEIDPPLDRWIYLWLDTYMRHSVRPSTLEKYTLCLKPIAKAFEGVRLSQLDSTRLQQFFQNQLFKGGRSGQGLSPVTVRNQRRYLISCIEMAVRLKLTRDNPAKLTLAPKVEKSEIHPLSEMEVEVLLSVSRKNIEDARKAQKKDPDNTDRGILMGAADLHIGVMIAVYTGMRLGEIMALKWSDLNTKTNFFSVQRSKSDVKGQFITSPKTGKGRKVQIGKELLRDLRKHKRIQNEYKRELGNIYEDNNWIIGGLFGRGYNKHHYSSRKFQGLLKQAKIIRHIRFHDLRHTHATVLLLAGINPKIVQERLGHASIDMTLDTYSHLTLANQGVAVDALDNMFGKKEK